MAGYVRQSAAEMVTDNIIYASHLNAEFNALQTAFSGTLGHAHDGTSGNGPKLNARFALENIPTMSVLGNSTNASDAVNYIALLDEDDMVSNSATDIPTQQSVKAYADTKQGLNATLTALSNTVTAANKLIYATGSATFATTDLTVYARSLLDDADAVAARTTLGLGSIATQNANAVALTGGTLAGLSATNLTVTSGTITGITDITIADGGTGASTAAGARTNLGLGNMALQDSTGISVTGGSISGVTLSGSTASSLTVTSGTITGITDITIADGGTGSSTAAGARTNLGVYSTGETDTAITTAINSIPPVSTQIHAATVKAALADNDEFGVADSAASWGLKRATLGNVITSIFKTTRTIPNAQFASATFKLFNAAGTPRALTFNTTALTADRVITMPDRSIDFNNIPLANVFVSSPITVTLGSNGLVAHNLPTTPTQISAYVVLTAAVGPMAIGDIVKAENQVVGSSVFGVQLSIPSGNSTQIKYQVAAGGLAAVISTNGASTSGVPANSGRIIIVAEV